MRTQVAIIGAGPSGLLLSHLLAARGIESILIENRSRDYVEARLRAGILEQQTVDLLTELGLGERLHRDGMQHNGIYLQWPGTRHQLDFADLCGRSVWVYGQTEVVKDLIEIGLQQGQSINFEVSHTAVHDIDTDRPWVGYVDSDGNAQRIDCQAIAGCDGFHGISRPAIPVATQQIWERGYEFSWLGILAAGATVHRRTHLRLAPQRVRHAQHALPDDQPALPPGRRRRAGSRTGPTTGSGPNCRPGWPSTGGA